MRFVQAISQPFAQIQLVWPSRWGASKVLFFANRYLAFVDPIMLVYSKFPYTHEARECPLIRELFPCLCKVVMFGSGATVCESTAGCHGRIIQRAFIGMRKRVSDLGRCVV